MSITIPKLRVPEDLVMPHEPGVTRPDAAHKVHQLTDDEPHEKSDAEQHARRNSQPPPSPSNRPSARPSARPGADAAAVVHLSYEARHPEARNDQGRDAPSGERRWVDGGPGGGHWHFEVGCPSCSQVIAAYRRSKIPGR